MFGGSLEVSRLKEDDTAMSLKACATCGHVYTNKDGDVCYADGGFMEANHGGGQCKACYLKSGHWQCRCGGLGLEGWKFCPSCGLENV